MGTSNYIDASYTGDLSQFYLGLPTTSNRGIIDADGEIVVTGNPSASVGGGGYTISFWDNAYLPGITYSYSGPNQSPYADAYDTSTYKNAAQLVFERAVVVRQQLEQKLTGISNDNDISVGGVDSHGNVISLNMAMGDIKAMFSNFTFNMIFKMDLGPGRGGFTACDGGNCFSNVDSKTITGYYANWGDAGLTYYHLHELAHNLPEVKAYELQEGFKYINVDGHPTYDDGYASSQYFNNIEKFANTVARRLGDYLGVDFPPNPPLGFLN